MTHILEGIRSKNAGSMLGEDCGGGGRRGFRVHSYATAEPLHDATEICRSFATVATFENYSGMCCLLMFAAWRTLILSQVRLLLSIVINDTVKSEPL